MLKNIKKKEGFTLVEILIVMFIIGLLSVLAVGGYSEYRKATLLEFSADEIISQVYELRDKTVHGDFGGEDAKCFSVKFSVDEGISRFDEDYSGKKVWDSVKDEFVYESCGKVSSEGTLQLDDLVSVDEIYSYSEFSRAVSDISEFSVTFIPPNGDFEFSNDVSVDSDYIVVVIKYGETEDDRYKQKLVFDLESGKIDSESY